MMLRSDGFDDVRVYYPNLCKPIALIDVNSLCVMLLLLFLFSSMMYYDRSFFSCTHAVTGFSPWRPSGRGKYLRFLVVIMI